MESRRAALRAGVIALIAGVLHVGLGAYACDDPIDGTKGAGEPCTRSDECQWMLECRGGICREVDAGTPLDAGPDAGEQRDAAIDDAAIDDAAIDDAAIDDAAISDAAISDAS